MATHVNFFETIQEANMRLRNTAITYDGEPYFVELITNHKDGKFRIYLRPVGIVEELRLQQPGNLSEYPFNTTPYDHPHIGNHMDAWMDANPKYEYIRKTMDSPHFNKFRPFPLGMCNYKGSVHFLERAPVRKTEQGLSFNMLAITLLDGNGPDRHGGSFRWDCKDFRDCVVGEYPTPQESLKKLFDPKVANKSIAFHRYFCLIKGQGGVCLFAYKGDVIGHLPNRDFNSLNMISSYNYATEVVTELGLFNTINFI